MAGISSLGIAVSGMQSAQAGLYVTGHNMANAATPGYTRQQVLQHDFLSTTIGATPTGKLQLGLGTDISSIRQIRNTFLDMSYRKTVSKTSFYDVKYNAGLEIDVIIGETEGQYKFQSVLLDMHSALNELMMNPSGADVRGNLITSAIAFIEKANETYESLRHFQSDLNNSIKDQVKQINSLANEVQYYNDLIARAEASGDTANDYRDRRNYALDQLASIANINVKERSNGSVDVLIEGKELVVSGMVYQIGLRYSGPNDDFVEPVFTTSSTILQYDPTGNNARSLFTFSRDISAFNENDNGSLKGLMIARGFKPANYTSSPGKLNPSSPSYDVDMFNITNCLIPKAQMELDTLVHEVVKMLNDIFAPAIDDPNDTNVPPRKIMDPNSPFGQDGTQGTELFSRANATYANRWTLDDTDPLNPVWVLNEENPDEYYSLYTIGNIVVNPDVVNPSGYKKIPTASQNTIDESDNDLIKKILKLWDSDLVGVDNEQKLNVNSFYKKIITDLGTETNEAKNFIESQSYLILEIEGFRDAVSGVSMDEELTNMMKYQHAFNAAARMVNIIDSMIDRIINGTGRVGI